MLSKMRAASFGIAGIALAGALALGGCQSGSADSDRVAELEAQVQELQSQLDAQGGATDSTTKDDSATTDTGSTTGSIAPEPDATVTSNYGDLGTFESRVVELENACKGATRSDDVNANYQTYLDMKAQIDQLDNEMDLYDDQQEHAARQGSIPYSDYIQIETQIDLLSDRLEYAEDSMQFALGIYDD